MDKLDGVNMVAARHLTIAILWLATLLLISYDAYVTVRWQQQATISDVILTVSRLHPILPLQFGILLGHLFWPQT
jgi:hypothetical protein